MAACSAPGLRDFAARVTRTAAATATTQTKPSRNGPNPRSFSNGHLLFKKRESRERQETDFESGRGERRESEPQSVRNGRSGPRRPSGRRRSKNVVSLP